MVIWMKATFIQGLALCDKGGRVQQGWIAQRHTLEEQIIL